MGTRFLVDGSGDAAWHVILAHGAGADARTPFMSTYARGLARRGNEIGGIQCLRFEFPYMVRARTTGRRQPPDGMTKLRTAWLDAIAETAQRLTPSQRLAVGGKSMGGRIATMVADEAQASAVVVLGYPFHPASRPERTRIAHLADIKTPTLILQGTRDPFGNREDVRGYALSATVSIQWLADGDHSFKPRRRSGMDEASNHETALAHIVEFLARLGHSPRPPDSTHLS